MKIVSPLGIVLAVLLAALVVGCSSGPGQAPADDMPDGEMPETPETEITGTFVAVPDANPLMGTITATITGVSVNGTPVTDPAALAAFFAESGLTGNMATFTYTLAPGATSTTITLSGDLLTNLAGGDVMGTREGAPDPTATAPLDGDWMGSVTHPDTMVTTNLTLNIAAPNFTLTVAPAAPATS